ncbi:MAG: hypothetical protein ACE145_09970 [Terriglobia bacterium]
MPGDRSLDEVVLDRPVAPERCDEHSIGVTSKPPGLAGIGKHVLEASRNRR